MTLRHIVLFFTLLLVAFSEGRAIGIERVAIKNGVFEAADNATRLRYSKAWNHLDLAESGSKVDPAVITNLADDILDNPALETFLEGGVGFVKVWEKLVNTELRTNINWLENVKEWIDEGLEFTSTTTKVIIKKVGVEVGEISEDLLKVKYSHFGGDVVCHQTKTTTVVGRFEGNISIIKESQLWKYGENPSGVNILNDPNWTWPINEQWLASAANRGDIIRAVSDPINIDNIWKNGIVGGEKTTFGLEVDLLDNLGYNFDVVKFQFVK